MSVKIITDECIEKNTIIFFSTPGNYFDYLFEMRLHNLILLKVILKSGTKQVTLNPVIFHGKKVVLKKSIRY